MPHDGPNSRQDAHFDAWAQFLVSRAYAVLQPQFRGSSGYGARHVDAGRFKWGLEMQNDLTDGVQHLVANGTVNAAKVCILGQGYGGYAAMAGLAFNRELYRCGISINGIADLPTWVDYWRRRGVAYLGAGKFWHEFVGDPVANKERLVATSPLRSVNGIDAPLLLMHATQNTRVPIGQSKAMLYAMRAAQRPVEFVELPDDNAELVRAASNKRALREIEAFLSKHLR